MILTKDYGGGILWVMPNERAPENLLPTIDENIITEPAEFNEGDQLEVAFQNIVRVQPELGLQVDNYIGLAGRDATERDSMKQAVVLIYSFLESQAEAETNLVRADGSLAKRNGIHHAIYPERKPDESLLPVVDNLTKHQVFAKLSEQPGLLDVTYWRVLEKQPELSLYIEAGRDSTEIQRIKEMMAIPYLLIEAQAEVDRMKLLTEDLPA